MAPADIREGPAEHGGDRAGTIADAPVQGIGQVQEVHHPFSRPAMDRGKGAGRVIRRFSSSWTRGLRLSRSMNVLERAIVRMHLSISASSFAGLWPAAGASLTSLVADLRGRDLERMAAA
jgi:hypothetical protein